MSTNDACAIAVEIDARQAYLFESDKLKEMLGASQIMSRSVAEAERLFRAEDGLFLFNPASGDVRVWAHIDQREALLRRAWALRDWFEQRGVAHSCAYIECSSAHFRRDASEARGDEGPSLSGVHRRLSEVASRQKVGQQQVDPRPLCSLFDACGIDATNPANHWLPLHPRQRRRLRSDRTAWKEREWNRVRMEVYAGALGDVLRQSRLPWSFDDLEDPSEDEGSQIAFLCADGDGIGGLLTNVDWNSPAWTTLLPHGGEPWERNRAFALALDGVVHGAYRDAVTELMRDTPLLDVGSRRVTVPFLPQLLGGDDLWTVARKDFALPLAIAFSRHFAARAAGDPVVRAACTVAALATDSAVSAPTVSLGVAFAKSGFPARAQVDAAEWLLNKSAKVLRKGLGWPNTASVNEGCLDWHWIESGVSEQIGDVRHSGWMHGSSSAWCRLTTRPWTVSFADTMLDVARDFGTIARTKREQLETRLRFEHVQSLLAWEQWWKSLTGGERAVMRRIDARLRSAGYVLDAHETFVGPWRHIGAGPADGTGSAPQVYDTPWLDLLSLGDVGTPPSRGDA